MPTQNYQAVSFPNEVKDRKTIITWDSSGNFQYQPVSQHSPGVLVSGDTIVRAVFCPQHFNKTGFSEDFVMDALIKGLSCQRVLTAPNSFIAATHSRFQEIADQAQLEPGKTKKYLGFLATRVGAIRSICNTSEDTFLRSHRARVYDTSLSNNPEHCDVFLNDFESSTNSYPRTIKNEIRSKLFNLFKEGIFFASPSLDESDDDLMHFRACLS